MTNQPIQVCKPKQNETVAMLASVLAQWRRTDVEPDIIGVLSSGERTAIYLAAEEHQRLPSPLYSFLVLDDPLQRWILEELGMSSFVGVTIGGHRP